MTNVKFPMELRTDRYKLKDVFPDRIKRYAEKLHINADEIEYVKKGIPIDPREIKVEEGERAAIRLITTPQLDRDYEILIPDGADLDDFRESPSVLFAHSYTSLPVGKDIWIKQTKRGILAKTVYANHQFAEDCFQCVRGHFLNSNSVGFIPVESVTPSDSRFRGVVDRLEKDYDISPDEANRARRIYTKWILLEHSDVPVASNVGALNIAVSKGELIIESSTMKKSLGLEPWEEITIEGEPDIAVKNDPHFFEFEPSVPKKILDAENNPSTQDLFMAISQALNPAPQNPSTPEGPPLPWYGVQEIFPVNFPNGHCIYVEYLAGRNINPSYRQDYNFSDGRATLTGERVEVVVAYREKSAEVITKPEPDVTENYIRLRQRDPDDFVKASLRTITISADKGIKAVAGKLKSDPDGSMVIQSYLFDKDKWTVAEAEAWVEKHKKAVFIIETSPDITIEGPEKSAEELIDAYLLSEDYKKAVSEAVEVAFAKIRGRVI